MALSYIEQKVQSFPDVQHYRIFEDLFRRKLWAQLSIEVQKILNVSPPPLNENIVELYNNFIKHFEIHMDQLIVGQVLGAVAQQMDNTEDAIQFLRDAICKIKNIDIDCLLICHMFLAQLQITIGTPTAIKEAKDLILSDQHILEGNLDLDSYVFSQFYYTSLLFYKKMNEPTNYLKSGLLYLSYTPLIQIPEENHIKLASELGLASLIGPHVFNFGELLQHPLLYSMKNTNYEWLIQLLDAFNTGNLPAFKRIYSQYASQQEVLSKNELFLKEKIRLCTLMEMAFRRSSDDRNIEFKNIADVCDIPLEQVEMLLMKAMSLQLIKGRMDQVEQIVTISYVFPRVLDLTQIAGLQDRVLYWADEVHKSSLFLEAISPELFVTL